MTPIGEAVPLTDRIDEIRARFPALRNCHYLNAGLFGPLPEAVASAMAARQARDVELGRSGASYFAEYIEHLGSARAAVARAIGAQPASIGLTRSTTDACNIVARGLGLGRGDEVVTTTAEHFGMTGPIAATGAALRLAEVEGRSPDDVVAALLELTTPRTKLIAISHVTWTTGQILPVKELAGRGWPLLVDGAQGAGAIPTDVAALGCDFYTVSGQKWLLGPEGTGALYVAPEWIERLSVALPSYLSQSAHTDDGLFEPEAGAARFDAGWVNAACLAGLAAAVEFAESIGPERFARAGQMAEQCRELLARKAPVVPSEPSATLVAFQPAESADLVVERLAQQRVLVRAIPGRETVRASIGWWTDDYDLERLVELV